MSTDMQLLSAASPLGSLDAYIARVNRVPMLTVDEEQELAKRFRNDDDIEAARKMVLAHLRYVVRIARGYMGYGLPLGDLIQEGNVGLMKAVKRFDPAVGVRLVSFAVHWIKAEIHEYVLRNWRIVKVATTKAQRKLFFNLRTMKKRLGWFTKAEVDAVAKDLDVSSAEVLRMETRLNAMDAAYDTSAADDSEVAYTPAQYLAADNADPAMLVEQQDTAAQGQEHLHAAMENLDDRSRDILSARWLAEKKATLHDLAKRYQVSAERIRQLEQNAMKKLRQAIQTVA